VPSTEVAAPSGQVEQLYSELAQKIRVLRPNEDLSGLDKAFRLALEAHKGQTRDSGEPYIMHPLRVAHILADMQMDMTCLETGLLHDTVEDTTVKLEDIKKEFGE
jgi:GTP diphosphokinase / guanosine-3',5'-bis(diphosphate) 3'-diphosphatase